MSKTSRGKKICGYLKGIRRKIAEENDIKLDIPECTYEGECRGTCPRCEWEVQYLEKTLFERMKLGKIATISGLALGLAACGGNFDSQPDDDIIGEMPMNVDSILQPPPPPPFEEYNVDENPDIDTTVDVDEVYIVPEKTPEFPGGEQALYEFLAKNIHYPQGAKESNIQGKVYIQFVVDKDGSIINPKVVRDIGGGCGEEAMRVVKMMPKWKPGDQRGVKIRTQFHLPITFELED